MTEEAMKLVNALHENAEWAHANEWETPITLGDNLESAADMIESLSAQLEQVTRERDMAIDELVRLEYPIPCESDELGSSEYCEENCRFKSPQKECWLRYFKERGVEVE